MVTEYKPKGNVYFNELRVQKQIKNVIDENKEDRKHALEAYNYFKERLVTDEGEPNAESQRLMLDSLKIAQSARNNTVKLLTLLNKTFEVEKSPSSKAKTKEKGSINPLFTKT
tara:strand:+ start:291 stop:629 length:339 start_codon:yes stop_codon:yes gene_type:complete